MILLDESVTHKGESFTHLIVKRILYTRKKENQHESIPRIRILCQYAFKDNGRTKLGRYEKRTGWVIRPSDKKQWDAWVKRIQSSKNYKELVSSTEEAILTEAWVSGSMEVGE